MKLIDIIDNYDKLGINFLDKLNIDILLSMIKLLDKKYYSGESIMSDSQYDKLTDYAVNKFPDYKSTIRSGHINCNIEGNNKCELPYLLPSMNKIKNIREHSEE